MVDLPNGHTVDSERLIAQKHVINTDIGIVAGFGLVIKADATLNIFYPGLSVDKQF